MMRMTWRTTLFSEAGFRHKAAFRAQGRQQENDEDFWAIQQHLRKLEMKERTCTAHLTTVQGIGLGTRNAIADAALPVAPAK